MIEQCWGEGGEWKGFGTWSRNRDPASSWRSLPLEEPSFITGTPGNAKDGGVTADWPAMCHCHGYHPWGQWKQMTGTIIWGVITKVSRLHSSPPHPPAIFPACRKKKEFSVAHRFSMSSYSKIPALTFIFIPLCCIILQFIASKQSL